MGQGLGDPRWRRSVVIVSALAGALLFTGAGAADSSPVPPALDGSGGVPGPAARLPSGGSAWEYWEITALLDSGHRVACRFLVTNAGPGDRNGVAIGRVIAPDGRVKEFHNGRRSHRWTLSDDRRRLDVGSSHLDLHGPVQRLWIDKRRVKIDLRYTVAGEAFSPAGVAPPDYHLDVVAVGVAPPDYHLDVVAVSAPIEGSLWLEGMDAPLPVRGRAALTHSWSKRPEVDLMLRRIEFFGLRDEDALYLIDFTTPAGSRSRWLGQSRGSDLRFATSEFALHLDGAAADRENTPYWVPGSLVLEGEQIGGRIRIERTLVEAHPLSALPGPIRFLFSLSMRPWRVWMDSPFEVRLPVDLDRERGGPLRGSGMVTVSFLDEVGRPDARAASGQELRDGVGVDPGQAIRQRVEGPDLARYEYLGEDRQADARRQRGQGGALERPAQEPPATHVD
jgi:hypothetical protein